MKPTKNIEKRIKNVEMDTNAKMDEVVLNDALKALENSKRGKSAFVKPTVWRTITKSKITKLAAAAVITVIAALSITFLDKSVTPAYAIEQTIEASKNLRYLYFEYFAGSENEPSKKCWVEFDETGQPNKIRVNMYKHWGGSLIAQAWKDGNTLMWQKDQNTLQSFKCEVHTAKMLKLVRECDPRTAISSLYERERTGDVRIEIEEPRDREKPIVIKGTFEPGKYLLEHPTLPSFRDILYVDQTTKLVSAKEIYELKGEEYQYNGVWKYPHCDKPFDAQIFDLENEVPLEVMRIVHYTSADVNNQGLEQGAYTNEQVAFIVVREFFNALIDEDYAKAGQLFGGMPADEAKERFGDLNVSRIVSISEPVRSEKAPGLRVPCTVEIEKDGEIIEWQPEGPFVWQVYRHAGRRRIVGGI